MSSSTSSGARSTAAKPVAPPGSQPVLRAQHLSKSYHSPVLRDLDLEVEQGQFVAIMGPSGSGKSTLLHCLSGMDQPDAGSVLLSGQEITSLSEKKLAALRLTRFGFVFQQAHLMTTLCLLDNIVLPGFLAGLRPRSEVSTCSGRFMPRGRLWSWSPTTPRWRPGPTASWSSWTGRSQRTCSWANMRRLKDPHAWRRSPRPSSAAACDGIRISDRRSRIHRCLTSARRHHAGPAGCRTCVRG